MATAVLPLVELEPPTAVPLTPDQLATVRSFGIFPENGLEPIPIELGRQMKSPTNSFFVTNVNGQTCIVQFNGRLFCCGGLIFSPNFDSIILVRDPKKGIFGFPKGTRENNKTEPPFTTSVREVFEETGLTPNKLTFLSNRRPIMEHSHNKPIFIVSYFLAVADPTIPLQSQDPTEDEPWWISIPDALEVLPFARQQTLLFAMKELGL